MHHQHRQKRVKVQVDVDDYYNRLSDLVADLKSGKNLVDEPENIQKLSVILQEADALRTIPIGLVKLFIACLNFDHVRAVKVLSRMDHNILSLYSDDLDVYYKGATKENVYKVFLATRVVTASLVKAVLGDLREDLKLLKHQGTYLKDDHEAVKLNENVIEALPVLAKTRSGLSLDSSYSLMAACLDLYCLIGKSDDASAYKAMLIDSIESLLITCPGIHPLLPQALHVLNNEKRDNPSIACIVHPKSNVKLYRQIVQSTETENHSAAVKKSMPSLLLAKIQSQNDIELVAPNHSTNLPEPTKTSSNDPLPDFCFEPSSDQDAWVNFSSF